MHTPLVVGIIGIGRWGTNCFRTLAALPDAEVRWICARTQKTMQAALAAVKPAAQPQCTTDCVDILEDPAVQAVLITTPAKTHYELVKAALLADKDVFVEKPFTLSLDEAEELVHIAEQRSRILMVGHIHCFNPAILKLSEDIRLGSFGNIKELRCDILHNETNRKDAGALWGMMPHAFSIFEALTGDQPQQVTATGDSDVVTLALSYPDGLTATAHGDWHSQEKRMRVELGGTRTAVFDDYAAEKLRYDGVPQQLPNTPPLTAELQHFLTCVRSRAEPITSGKRSLPVMRVLDAAQRSLAQGKAIRL